ncbi:hypothetical protein FXO37_13300 [Capsicum annuum]|nr:hypothetical protein FXO37_13300 [Capsicum annuum]
MLRRCDLKFTSRLHLSLRHEHHSECKSPKPASCALTTKSPLPSEAGQRLYRSCSPKAREPNVDASPHSSHHLGKHGIFLHRGIQLPNESDLSESDILPYKHVIDPSQSSFHSLNPSGSTLPEQHTTYSGRKPRRGKHNSNRLTKTVQPGTSRGSGLPWGTKHRGLSFRKHVSQRVQIALQRNYFSVLSIELEEMPPENPQSSGFYPSSRDLEGTRDEGNPDQHKEVEEGERESNRPCQNDKLSNLEYKRC